MCTIVFCRLLSPPFPLSALKVERKGCLGSVGNPVAETNCPPERGQVLISVAVAKTRRCKKWGNASPPSLAWPSSAQIGRERVRESGGGRGMKVHAQLITDACNR